MNLLYPVLFLATLSTQVYVSRSQQQQEQAAFQPLYPWYYWLNYIKQIYISPTEDPTMLPTSTPCTVEFNCLDGDIFNTTSCQCEPIDLSKPMQGGEEQPTEYTTTTPPTSCNISDCPRRSSLDVNSCKCVCSYKLKCNGLRRYNDTLCRCECTHPYECRTNEYFNILLCVCMPITPYRPTRPRPITIRPSVPVIQPSPVTLYVPFQQHQQPPPCRPTQCTGHQLFSTVHCACYCPLDAARHCHDRQILDSTTCQCVCPSLSLVAARCSDSIHYYDATDCSCKCRVSNSVCSHNLQIFNPTTCQCQCQRFYVTIQRRSDGQILHYTKRSIKWSEDDEDREATEEERTRVPRKHAHLDKRMAKTKKRNRTKSGSHKGTKGKKHTKLIPSTDEPTAVQNLQTVQTQLLVVYSCPAGTNINYSTCSCM